MPIKGLTERRRLPRIGKIHLGIRVPATEKTKEHPKAVDYFVFDPQHPHYDELVAMFGEQPKELHVVFPSDDPEQFASQYYRLYSSSRGLVCKGDGETAMRMIDTTTGALANRDSKEVVNREVACQGRECPDYGKCGEVMNLQFLLPQISGFGVWQIDTGSINSILNVNNALDLVRQIYNRVKMVPLVLALEPKEVTNPDDGKKKTVRVLNIRSEDKMIEAFSKSRMEPVALVQGMYEDGETLELPEAGDTAPFIDLPSITEQRVAELSKVDLAKAEKDAAAMWQPDPTNAQAAAQAAHEAAKQREPQPTLEENITFISQGDTLPTSPKHRERLCVIETNEVLEWEQIDEKSGRWRNMGVNPQPAQRQHDPTPDKDTPATTVDFFKWLQTKGRKFGPTWFYKSFTGYNAESMQDPGVIAVAYQEVKKIMDW